jgi:hypothetical protein
MGGACSTREKIGDAYSIVVGKPEGKRSLGRSKHRWQDNIEIVRET